MTKSTNQNEPEEFPSLELRCKSDPKNSMNQSSKQDSYIANTRLHTMSLHFFHQENENTVRKVISFSI